MPSSSVYKGDVSRQLSLVVGAGLHTGAGLLQRELVSRDGAGLHRFWELDLWNRSWISWSCAFWSWTFGTGAGPASSTGAGIFGNWIPGAGSPSSEPDFITGSGIYRNWIPGAGSPSLELDLVTGAGSPSSELDLLTGTGVLDLNLLPRSWISRLGAGLLGAGLPLWSWTPLLRP